MTAVLEHTVLPPDDDAPQVSQALDVARRGAKLVGPDGTAVTLPTAVIDVLRHVLGALEQGQAITIAPHNTLLRTQEAAKLLGISRPTLVRLLEAGEIPFETRGRYRRVRLPDLIAYQERSRRDAEAAFAEMVSDGEDDGLYEATMNAEPTR